MSGFKESAGTMTLYIKMNRHLRMMLQHGLSSSYNRDSRTREGGGGSGSGRQNEREGGGGSGSGRQIEREGGGGSGRIQRESGSGSGCQDERDVGSGSVILRLFIVRFRYFV